MIPLPTSLISAKAVLILAGALALSLAGNVALLWQWAEAKPEAELKCATASLESTQAAEKAEDRRDTASLTISRENAAEAEEQAIETQTHTDQVKKEIQDDYRDRPTPAVPACTGEPPAGVRDRLDALRERANAAGR